jgi:hypothetical protein
MDEKERKMKTTKFFIEANSFEMFELWRQNKGIWKEDNSGFSQVIGHIKGDKDLLVNVSFMFAKIHNVRVCFYEVVSRYSDSVMVEDWIKENYPVTYDKGSRIAMTNATNFHHALQACEINEFDR